MRREENWGTGVEGTGLVSLRAVDNRHCKTQSKEMGDHPLTFNVFLKKITRRGRGTTGGRNKSWVNLGPCPAVKGCFGKPTKKNRRKGKGRPGQKGAKGAKKGRGKKGGGLTTKTSTGTG